MQRGDYGGERGKGDLDAVVEFARRCLGGRECDVRFAPGGRRLVRVQVHAGFARSAAGLSFAGELADEVADEIERAYPVATWDVTVRYNYARNVHEITFESE